MRTAAQTPLCSFRSPMCSTGQGILGYVNVASGPTRFQITAYSPPASLFEQSRGAKVTTATTAGR